MKNIDIIAACSDLGVTVNGSNLGPEILLKNIKNKNYIRKIKEIHYDITYKKELNLKNNQRNINQINLFNSKLYAEIKKTLANHCLPITLGRNT